MTRRILAILSGLMLLGIASVAPVNAAYDVGAHEHVAIADHPVDGFPIPRAPHTFQVTLKLHDQPGKATSFRVSDYSHVVKTVAIALGPCTDCSMTFPFTVDFSTWAVGRHELRWTVNIPKNPDGNRQFVTSRAMVCIQSCSPNVSGRATPWLGGGGWYTGHDYVIALLLSPQSAVRPGGSVIIRSQYGSSTSLCAYLNPDFHHGSHGTILGCFGGGTAKRTLGLSGVAPGDHLVIVASDGLEAGVLNLVVGDGSPRATADLEFQDWWAKGGLSIP